MKCSVRRRCGLRKNWLVLMACICSTLICDAIPFHMSVLFVEFLEEFQRSKAETILVQSVCTGVFLCAGFLSGVSVSRFGESKCMFLGSLLASIGLASSFFATSIPFLVASIGIVAGLGFSLSYVASYSMVPLYFRDNQKMIALGILSLGPAIGSLVIPILLQKLTYIYDWRGTLLILGGVASNICVSATLGSHWRVKHSKKFMSNGEVYIIQRHQKEKGHNVHVSSESLSLSKEVKARLHVRVKTLFTNKPFVLYGLTVIMTFPPIIAILMFLIDYYQVKGFPRPTGVWLYIAMNVASFACRIIMVFLVKFERIPKLAIPLCLNIIGSFAMFAFPFIKTVPECAVVACLFGASFGGMVSLISITSLDLVGKDDYPLALGIIRTLLGVANAVAGPLSGLDRDLTGTYNNTFYVGGGCLFCAGLTLFFAVVYQRKISATRAISINSV